MRFNIITKAGIFCCFSLLLQGCLERKQIDSSNSSTSALLEDYESDGAKKPSGIYAEHVRTTEWKSPEEERLSFILPPGFEATLFASEPDITKPINMAFDEKGRLWVTQSSEYPIEAGDNGGHDRITILEDTDRDGRADKITDFANDLNIPIGILPIKNGAIGYSIPNVYKFIDSDNDGKADKREIMLGKFGHKDTHGMVNNLIRGFDGWIHASHGFSNTSIVAGSDGDSIKMFSGNTFRFREDGSRVEKTSDGRINPFGTDYDEMGYQYSADCHTLPIFQMIWGGNYQQWGKVEPVMGFAPTMMDYGLNSTALSGLVYYTDNQFPTQYQHTFFSGDVVTCRISHNVMTYNGSTPKATRKKDFMVSQDPWFRPVDIKIGPDGAMYIADFYNRIIGHYEVPLGHPGRDRVSGRIWKITYKGNQRKITDWSKADLPALLEGLNHEVLDIRMTATNELVARFGKAAIPSLTKMVRKKSTDPKQLIQGMWALFQLKALPNDVLAAALKHPDVRVKVHAYKMMANNDKLSADQRSLVIKGLENKNPHVQRAAAEVLGRHPDQENVKPLVTLRSLIPDYDTHLRYTVLLSIQNHLKQEDIMRQAVSTNWNKQDAGVIAMVAADLESDYVGKFLLKYLKTYEQPKNSLEGYIRSISRTIPASDLEEVINYVKKVSANDPGQQFRLAMAINKGMQQRGRKNTPALQKWYVELATNALNNPPRNGAKWTDDDKFEQRYATEIIGKYKVQSMEPALRALVINQNADADTRSLAAEGLMVIAPKQSGSLLLKAISNGEETLSMRKKFAWALGQNELPHAQLGQTLKVAPPEVQQIIAGSLARTTEGKTELLKLIREGYAPARLLKEPKVEEALLEKIQSGQRREYEALTANVQPLSAERQQIIEKRLIEFNPNGKTPEMGKAIFIKNCSMCHQIDKTGGLIGPQLDGIGNWGRTALTTKILDPNRNITESFRMYNVNLKNGKSVSGLYRREEGQLLVFADQAGQEFTIPQQDIKEKIASKYTLMPDHFSGTIPKDEFDALMVYLLSQVK